MTKFLAIVGACAAMALATTPARAADLITVSFENPALGSGGYAYVGQPFPSPTVPAGFFAIPNVAFTGASGIQANNSAWGFAATPDGNQTAFVQSYNGVGGAISISLFGLTPGKEYFVSFAAAGRPGYGVNPFTLIAPGSSTPFSISNTAWGNYQTSFVANGTSGTLIFAGSNIAGDSAFALDRIAVAIPEPATWAMMLLGFGMIGFAIRRQKPAKRPLLAH
jgi:hypothetical protein